MNDSRDTARDAALRRMLVQRVSAVPNSRARWRLPALAFGAFALGSVMTAGTLLAFATLSSGGGGAAATPVTVDFPDVARMLDDDAQILGSPVFSTGQQTTTIDLGEAPAGANAIVIAGACVDVSEMRYLLDGQAQGGLQCTAEEGRPMSGGGGGITLFGDEPPRVLSIQVLHGTYVVSALWAFQPPDAEPSAAQAEAMADGVVTREEYEAGFDRYVACMADLGFAVSPVGMRDAEILGYVIPGDAGRSGAANRCYEAEFQEVDMHWQVAHAD